MFDVNQRFAVNLRSPLVNSAELDSGARRACGHRTAGVMELGFCDCVGMSSIIGPLIRYPSGYYYASHLNLSTEHRVTPDELAGAGAIPAGGDMLRASTSLPRQSRPRQSHVPIKGRRCAKPAGIRTRIRARIRRQIRDAFTSGAVTKTVGLHRWNRSPSQPVLRKAGSSECALGLTRVVAQRPDQRVRRGLLHDVGCPPGDAAHDEDRCETRDVEAH